MHNDANHLFELSTGRMDQDGFDRLLAWSVLQEVSELSLQAGENVWADIGGQWRPVTNKTLTQAEVAEMVRATYGDNGPSICNAGKDLHYGYDTKVPPEYEERVGSKRMRFRVNATSGRLKDQDGFGFQISLKPLAVPQTKH